MDFLPVLIVVGVYGAAAWLLTLWIRRTLARHAPSVERWLTRVEIAKRLHPCIVAFALLSASPSSVLAWFGLSLEGCDFWASAWMLSIFSGIFSGYAHHWLRDTYKRKRAPAPAPDDVPPDADAP
jgi:hypothetical protein